jgi:hypothetical protein
MPWVVARNMVTNTALGVNDQEKLLRSAALSGPSAEADEIDKTTFTS